MNPLNFVGQPDWRSALLAILLAIPWFLLLVRKRIRIPWIWVVLLAGIVLFPLSIAYIQVPIQNGINTLYIRYLSNEVLQKYLLLIEDEKLWEKFKEIISKDINTEIIDLIKDKLNKKEGKK